MSVKIIKDVVTSDEAQIIVADLIKLHPEITKKNLHLELNEDFRFLDYIPLLHGPELKHQIGRYVVSMCESGWYPGEKWHVDGTSDEITMLLYISGDNTHGGDFVTKESTVKFELNSLFILNSSISHFVTPYINSVPRIAFKWRYKI